MPEHFKALKCTRALGEWGPFPSSMHSPLPCHQEWGQSSEATNMAAPLSLQSTEKETSTQDKTAILGAAVPSLPQDGFLPANT